MTPRSEYWSRGRGSRHWQWGAIALGGALVTPSACVFDPDDRCGPHQVPYGDNQRCVCEDGYAWAEGGCVACEDHEVASADGCVCEEGYSRLTEGGPCELPPPGLGAECDEDNPCGEPYPQCEPVDGATGYCTSVGCETSDDCEAGYACDDTVDPTVCRRPPTGLGQPCESDEDCAGTEATYCDLFVTMGCLVQGCTLDPDNCFVGYECCDLSGFGIAEPLCVALAEGGCTT
ncbi:MAG: hypothetical protein JW751_14515 [Polyangiaceae bacterium]|nr:hypothetical protein [Polyangiaceae bacterium]